MSSIHMRLLEVQVCVCVREDELMGGGTSYTLLAYFSQIQAAFKKTKKAPFRVKRNYSTFMHFQLQQVCTNVGYYISSGKKLVITIYNSFFRRCSLFTYWQTARTTLYPWLQLVEALKDGWWQHGTTRSMVHHRLFLILSLFIQFA